MKTKLRQFMRVRSLMAVLALAVALSSCEVIAAVDGGAQGAETVWLRLIPGVPFEDGGTLTAELSLDFSRAISGLETGVDEAKLAEIFSFELINTDGTTATTEIKATGLIKYAEAFYKLTVVNVPRTGGIAKLTVNRPGITPPFRLWSLDGREIGDCTVSFDPAGGVLVGSGTVVVAAGGTVALFPSASRQNFDFGGWRTARDGGGTAFGGSTVVNASLTVFAQLTALAPGAFTVSFDVDGGSPIGMSASTAGGAGTVALPSPPARAGFEFGGWFTAKNGGGEQFSAASVVESTMTVYAAWIASGTGLILLDPNGGVSSGVPAEGKLIAVGAGYQLPNPNGSGFEWQDALPSITQPAPAARSFINWNTKADGSGTPYSVGTTITAGITLYAQWTPVWTVSFALNGGVDTAPESQTVAAGTGTAFNLPGGSGMNAPANKTFWYWDTAQDGYGTNYSAGANYTPAANSTLYAKWTGDGLSDANPTEIHNRADLEAIANGMDKHYKLVDDIYLYDWTPMSSYPNYFSGALDGDGKTITFDGTITAIVESSDGTKLAGLFGALLGTVKNLNIEGTVTSSSDSGKLEVGAVAGLMCDLGAISNVKSTATVHAEGLGCFVGGIAGHLWVAATISDCWTTGAVSAVGGTERVYVGGIVGMQEGEDSEGENSTDVTNCWTRSALAATSTEGYVFAGGITGMTNASRTTSSVALNLSISASTSGAVNTGRIRGQGSLGASNNWAKNPMTVNSGTVSSGLQNDKDGANFGTATTKASWTNAPDAALNPGPGWTIADSKAQANEAEPWWWDGDHPALFWE